MASVKFAVIDVNDFLTKKQAAEPELASDWSTLEELYNKKLWHQLTLKLEEFVKHPSLQKGNNLIDLYNNFITIFENKINPLALIEISAYIVNQYVNKKDAVGFLEKLEPKVKANEEALALCKVLQGQIYLENLNDLDATEKIITHLEGSLEDVDGVTPVHGRFYKLASEYYKVRGPLARYYRATLRHVGCCDGGLQLAAEERPVIAKELALAGVFAHDVYDLNELLAHPILESLEGTPWSWAADLVKAVAEGSLVKYEALRHHVTSPELTAKEIQLRQKIAILCLMQMAFNRTSAERKLTFAEIASEARIPLNEVELLVMKALAEKLIRGHIDQVSRNVSVSWCRPHALTRSQISGLAARLDAWCVSVDHASTMLERHAADVLTA